MWSDAGVRSFVLLVVLSGCGARPVCEGPACVARCTGTSPGDTCDVSAGDRSNLTCEVATCRGAVGERSSVTCGTRAACTLEAGPRSAVVCRDASACTLTVAEESSVTCEDFAVCSVVCGASCAVSCRDRADCRCVGEGCVLTCPMGPPTRCADGRLACAC